MSLYRQAPSTAYAPAPWPRPSSWFRAEPGRARTRHMGRRLPQHRRIACTTAHLAPGEAGAPLEGVWHCVADQLQADVRLKEGHCGPHGRHPHVVDDHEAVPPDEAERIVNVEE